MPIIHQSYEGRTELRTARKPYRCQHQRLSCLIDYNGDSICGCAILPGDQYVTETAMPWSDAGPFYRVEVTQEPVIRSGIFLYNREVRKRVRTVAAIRLCLNCAATESYAYRRHTGAFERRSNAGAF